MRRRGGSGGDVERARVEIGGRREDIGGQTEVHRAWAAGERLAHRLPDKHRDPAPGPWPWRSTSSSRASARSRRPPSSSRVPRRRASAARTSGRARRARSRARAEAADEVVRARPHLAVAGRETPGRGKVAAAIQAAEDSWRVPRWRIRARPRRRRGTARASRRTPNRSRTPAATSARAQRGPPSRPHAAAGRVHGSRPRRSPSSAGQPRDRGRKVGIVWPIRLPRYTVRRSGPPNVTLAIIGARVPAAEPGSRA